MIRADLLERPRRRTNREGDWRWRRIIEATVESLDHPVDNAPVRSLVHKGLTIEGYSRAAVQTYWRIPELKLGFDLGGQPWSFMATPTWFVSHTHLDHLAALPVYVARRRMMKMEPPTIYLPAEAVEGVEMLLRAFQRLDRGRMPANLVGLTPGQEVELSRELVVHAFADPAHDPLARLPGLGAAQEAQARVRAPDRRRRRDPRPAALGRRGLGRDPPARRWPTWATPPRRGSTPSPTIYRAEILILEMTFVAPGRAGRGHPQVRPHPPRRHRRPRRPVRERGDHRLALQHPAAPRPDPADRRASGCPSRSGDG